LRLPRIKSGVKSAGNNKISVTLMEKGYVQIYTGDGKGKTLAALGLALRAAGAGLRCLIVQFMKEGFPYSELASLSELSGKITVERYGTDTHVLEKRTPSEEECAAARRGLDRAREGMTGNDFDIVILDEVCPAVHFGLFTEDEVTRLLDIRPETVELILTGRYCQQTWIERADLVTEMREMKHYYRQGVLSRKGIDS